MQPNVSRVLGFDPGFERLGVAVVEKVAGKEALLYSGCLRTSAARSFPERLREIGSEMQRLVKEWSPTLVALEDIYFENNAKTAIQVAQVRGVLAYEGAVAGLTVCSYSPLQVKVAVTGYGRSDKKAVATMVGHLVQLPDRKRLDDELDAIAVALTCLAHESSRKGK